ncbi:CBS domain-containing protein [Actinacidiphila soli]|uniref:CBS domain-containing protein n=1 Tax=Actinacidiphila soli TaxID=2487275 RepID=UPI000FCBEEC9|nr:CBS domain-containing protein [Actinacidiphila soli]
MIPNPPTVGDVMTSTVVAVARGASFKEIVRTLAKWKVSAVTVLEGRNRVIGVVSEADLLRKEEARDVAPLPGGETARAEAVTAGQLMTAPAVTVRADASLAQAARAMALHRVKRLPVVDAEGRLRGVVSRGDLLKVFVRPDADIARDVRRVAAECLPASWESVEVRVDEGVVTLGGLVHDTSVVPLAARLVRTVEGVVDVTFDITSSPPVTVS